MKTTHQRVLALIGVLGMLVLSLLLLLLIVADPQAVSENKPEQMRGIYTHAELLFDRQDAVAVYWNDQYEYMRRARRRVEDILIDLCREYRREPGVWKHCGRYFAEQYFDGSQGQRPLLLRPDAPAPPG